MNSLDKTLDLFVSSEPDPSAIAAAQGRLEAAVAARAAARPARPSTRRLGGWVAAATSAAALTFAILWLPLNPTPAFAQVQEHFRDFRTLRFDMKQRVGGREAMSVRVSMTRRGDVRTDIGKDMSVIVNSSDGRVLTLIHGARLAVEDSRGSEAGDVDALAWLDDVREFQGAATRLPQPRVIDGRTAYGWRLKAGGLDMELWATAEGLPLEMQMNGAGQMRFDFDFEFDVALPAETFSTAIPAGYSRGEAED
jgi:outer membrane lipoprotein-sorting protein